MRGVPDRDGDEGELTAMATSSFRVYSAMVGVLIMIAGLILGGGALALRVVGGTTPKAGPIVWLWIGGGVVFVLLGVFMFGVALGRNDKPSCPHCSRPVEVHVATWSGRIQLDKGGSK